MTEIYLVIKSFIKDISALAQIDVFLGEINCKIGMFWSAVSTYFMQAD